LQPFTKLTTCAQNSLQFGGFLAGFRVVFLREKMAKNGRILRKKTPEKDWKMSLQSTLSEMDELMRHSLVCHGADCPLG
jgi:hypothetical protein